MYLPEIFKARRRMDRLHHFRFAALHCPVVHDCHALMQRVHDLDPDYHFAGSDLFFGTYYASRPAILGGDAAKAKAFFQEARRRTGGKYLMTYVLEARYYAVAAQDQELFKGLLAKVKDAESGALPDARLTDEVAKRKAGLLLEKINDYF